MTTEIEKPELKVLRRHRVPGLSELVFEGRNRAYGSYDLRRRYLRYLLVASCSGIVLFLVLTIIPFALLYLEGPSLIDTNETMYVVDYDFMVPPGDDLNELARRMAALPEEQSGPPAVVDSVPPPPKETPKVVETEKEKNPDSTTSDKQNPGGGENDKGAGSGDDEGIYTTIDVYPRFPGGDQARIYYLRTHIRYPEIALKMGVEGTILAVFVIEINGSVTNVEIARGINKYCDEEAIRVIKAMPNWEPGKRAGRPVRVMVRMPIIFKIPVRK